MRLAAVDRRKEALRRLSDPPVHVFRQHRDRSGRETWLWIASYRHDPTPELLYDDHGPGSYRVDPTRHGTWPNGDGPAPYTVIVRRRDG